MDESVKKRGRKQKEETSEIELEDNKVQKKRGRKPKEKSYSISKPIVTQLENINEHIILYLPITITDIENDCPDIVINNEDKKNEPVPFTPNSNFDEVEETSNEHH